MKRSIAASLLVLLFPTAVWATEIAMVPVQCTNLTDGECAAVGAVFAGAFATASGAQVALVPDPAAAAAPAPYAAPAAVPASAPPTAVERLTVSATRLTSRIALRAALNHIDGAPIHAVDMMATTLDDLPPAAERMSRALVNRTSVDQTMDLHNITKTEGRKVNRTTTEKVVGVKTALIVPFASGVDLDAMLAAQFDARFESDRYFLEIGAGLVLPSDSQNHKGYGGLFAEFGASAYLGADGSPLYVGGGVSPRLFFSSAEGGVQAAIYGQVGLMFMRTSSTRLYLELRTSQNAIPIKIGGGTTYEPSTPNNPNGSYQTTTAKSVYPTELALQMGIGW
jgi:hypothetical protein